MASISLCCSLGSCRWLITSSDTSAVSVCMPSMCGILQVESGRSSKYCYDEAQLQKHLTSLGSNPRNIQRFKVPLALLLLLVLLVLLLLPPLLWAKGSAGAPLLDEHTPAQQ